MALTLGALAAALPQARLQGDPGRAVDRVTTDSREAGPDALFVAVRGSARDGHDFLGEALRRGCRAVAVESAASLADSLPADAGPGVDVIIAPDTRPAPALMARLLCGQPDLKLVAAGVTGTNGKTTVSFLLRQLLADLYREPCGLLGTISYETGARSCPAPLTTPDGPLFYEWLARMVADGCRSVAMEISSHALDQQRVAGLQLDVAVMTNLGRDHLDYHRTPDRYLAAKARILDLLGPKEGPGGPTGGTAVINAGDSALATLPLRDRPAVLFAAGAAAGPRPADLQVTAADLSPRGTALRLRWRGRELRLQSPLVGRFNVENLTAALAAGLALGADPQECALALGRTPQVPGRLERFLLPQGALAVVDYAHTPDALQAVLAACDELRRGRLLVVFGCGGDRDRGKRPLMGRAAAQGSDAAWITNDNPRSEDPAAIAAQIAAGFAGASDPRCRRRDILLDRRAAITEALADARDGDVVLIAGKGHEDYQLVGAQVLDLDDRRIVRDWIAQREGRA